MVVLLLVVVTLTNLMLLLGMLKRVEAASIAASMMVLLLLLAGPADVFLSWSLTVLGAGLELSPVSLPMFRVELMRVLLMSSETAI